jgi:hypothetical protein
LSWTDKWLRPLLGFFSLLGLIYLVLGWRGCLIYLALGLPVSLIETGVELKGIRKKRFRVTPLYVLTAFTANWVVWPTVALKALD